MGYLVAFKVLEEMELFARCRINGPKRRACLKNGRLQVGSVVKEQVVLKQMLFAMYLF